MHHFQISDLIVGGMLTLSGVSCYIWVRTHPDLVPGVAYRQLLWGSIGMIVFGILIAVVRVFIPS